MSKRHAIVVVTVMITSFLALAPAAHAGGGGGGDVIRRGSCSGRSEWKLKVKPDNGRLELQFEVDSNVNGQTWNVRIKQNGSRIFAGTRTTTLRAARSKSRVVRTMRPDPTASPRAQRTRPRGRPASGAYRSEVRPAG